MFLRRYSFYCGLKRLLPSWRKFLIWSPTFSQLLFCSYGLGFIGNLLALVVFSSLDDFRKISTGLLFLCLTISNFIHLSTLTFESLSVYGYSLLPTIFLHCQLNPFIQNVTRGLSTYLSVGIVVDRLIRSELPVRSRTLCTRRNVLIMSMILLIVFSVVWCLYLVSFSSRDANTGQCLYNASMRYSFYLDNASVSLRAVLFSVIPVVLMVAANLRMLQNIRRSQLRVGDVMKLVEKTNRSATISSVVITGPICRRVSATDRMLSYMVMSNVVTFVVTQIPLDIYSVVEVYAMVFDDGRKKILAYNMVLIWSSIYFGIAFYFYCLASPLFRKKFINMAKRMYSIVFPAKPWNSPAKEYRGTSLSH